MGWLRDMYIVNALSGKKHDPPLVADELTKLADLRDRGVLTEDEFQAQKKKLLGDSDTPEWARPIWRAPE